MHHWYDIVPKASKNVGNKEACASLTLVPNIIMTPEGDVEEGAGKMRVEPHQEQKWWTQPWSTSDPLEEPEAVVVLYYIEVNDEIHQNTVEKLIEKYTRETKSSLTDTGPNFEMG